MKVRLIDFHCIIDVELILENHTAYRACTVLWKIRGSLLTESTLYLAELK